MCNLKCPQEEEQIDVISEHEEDLDKFEKYPGLITPDKIKTALDKTKQVRDQANARNEELEKIMEDL